MKNISIILTIAFSMISLSDISAQNFLRLLKNNNYSALLNHTNSKVKLEIDRKKQTKSAKAAIKIIEEKLNAFKPVNWERIHKGTSEGKDANYMIAKIYNQEGEGMRLFLSIDNDGGKRKISSIRIRELL